MTPGPSVSWSSKISRRKSYWCTWEVPKRHHLVQLTIMTTSGGNKRNTLSENTSCRIYSPYYGSYPLRFSIYSRARILRCVLYTWPTRHSKLVGEVGRTPFPLSKDLHHSGCPRQLVRLRPFLSTRPVSPVVLGRFRTHYGRDVHIPGGSS